MKRSISILTAALFAGAIAAPALAQVLPGADTSTKAQVNTPVGGVNADVNAKAPTAASGDTGKAMTDKMTGTTESGAKMAKETGKHLKHKGKKSAEKAEDSASGMAPEGGANVGASAGAGATTSAPSGTESK